MDHVLCPTTKQDGDFLTEYGMLQEERSFRHFMTETSLRIPSIFDLPVWTEIIPMLSTTFPSIRYAVLALSAQHEIMLHNSSRNNRDRDDEKSSNPVVNALRYFSYNQYDKAIRRLNMILVDAVQKYDVLVETLFACLLLIIFEILRGSDVAAQYHLDGAIRLICMPSLAKSRLFLENESSSSNRRSSSSLFRSLRRLSLSLQQLDLQAAAFSGPRIPIFPEDIDSITQYSTFDSQSAQITGRGIASRSTIEELRQILISIQIKVSRFIDSETVISCKYRSRLRQTQNEEYEFNTVKEMQESLLGQLEHWKSDFETSSSESKEGLNFRKQRAAITMLLSHLTSYVLLSASLCPDEMGYDSHTATFAHIIELSEGFLKPQLESNTLPSPLPFTIDMQAIYPLYVTALKCREHTMRSRAVHLLSMCGREGVWDGRMMASIARSVIVCEEDFAIRSTSIVREDEISTVAIPESARIHGVGITYIDREKGEVRLICSRKTGLMTMDNQVSWETVQLYAEF